MPYLEYDFLFYIRYEVPSIADKKGGPRVEAPEKVTLLFINDVLQDTLELERKKYISKNECITETSQQHHNNSNNRQIDSLFSSLSS